MSFCSRHDQMSPYIIEWFFGPWPWLKYKLFLGCKLGVQDQGAFFIVFLQQTSKSMRGAHLSGQAFQNVTTTQNTAMPATAPTIHFHPMLRKNHPTLTRSIFMKAKPLMEPMHNTPPPAAEAKAESFQ